MKAGGRGCGLRAHHRDRIFGRLRARQWQRRTAGQRQIREAGSEQRMGARIEQEPKLGAARPLTSPRNEECVAAELGCLLQQRLQEALGAAAQILFFSVQQGNIDVGPTGRTARINLDLLRCARHQRARRCIQRRCGDQWRAAASPQGDRQPDRFSSLQPRAAAYARFVPEANRGWFRASGGRAAAAVWFTRKRRGTKES